MLKAHALLAVYSLGLVGFLAPSHATAEVFSGSLSSRGTGLAICSVQNNSPVNHWVSSLYFSGTCVKSDDSTRWVSGSTPCIGNCTLASYLLVELSLGFGAIPSDCLSVVGTCTVFASPQ